MAKTVFSGSTKENGLSRRRAVDSQHDIAQALDVPFRRVEPAFDEGEMGAEKERGKTKNEVGR